MTFEHPYILLWLWAVLVVPVLFLIGRARRRHILGRYATAEGLDRIASRASNRRRWVKTLLAMAAFVLMVIALAGPRYGYKWETVKRRGVDIVVALDCSRSMLAEDIDPNRLQRAKREIIDLLGRLSGDRIGLVAFAGRAFIQCPLTMDGAAFQIFLKALSPDYLPVGGTNLATALETCLDAFDAESPADKAIILITDGEHTADGDPVEIAKKARRQGIKIFCIGVGGESGAPVPVDGEGFKKDRSGKIVLTRLDEATLRRMADLTGGAYVRSVAGDMDLDVIYHDHIRQTMTEATLESGKKRVWENRFQWFTGLALLCLAIATILPAVKPQKSVTPVLAIALLIAVMNSGTARAGSVYGDVRQGRAAYEKGAHEKALKHFIDAQLKDPENPSLYYNMGDAYYKMNKYDEALRHYDKALSMAKDDAFKDKILYNRGNAHFRAGDYKKAIDDYQKALELAPEDRRAKENLELAKKALKRRQQQPQQAGDGRDAKDGDKKKDKSRGAKDGEQLENGEKRQKSEDAGETSADEKKNRQSGSQSGASASKEDQQPPPPKPRQADGRGQEPQADDSAERKTAGPGDPGDPGDNDPAERRLRRLKDKPGAALVPAYDGPPVEKDW
ncbi:MAG: VWA domain-containing protein [Thermodesulfobacteriota bacterium]|nr:VWA domain-containing protein [Thermodesulfobacteriota bacterium]